ncbi:NB-ARC domain-containing protein [Streptomyces bacillaris]
MRGPHVGPDLAAGLGPLSAQALHESATLLRRHYELDRWLSGGGDRVRSAIVFETDDQRTTRLVLKVVPKGDGPLGEAAFARHRRAYDEAPVAFAADHLSALVNEPIRVDDGSWIVFETIAGDDSEDVEALGTLLRTMLGGPASLGGRTACDPQEFVRACGQLVGGILDEWVERPRTAARPLSVADFVRRHLPERIEPGTVLHRLSATHTGDWITLDADGGRAPNPFALLEGAFYGDEVTVRVLAGKTHGNLRPQNVLVRVRPSLCGTLFHLLDLARYEPDGALTRDPVGLVLHIAEQALEVLGDLERSALIDALVQPEKGRLAMLPGWLAAVVTEVSDACARWLRGSGLQPEWRRQWLLSLVGTALRFTGAASDRPKEQDWFLRLAARAAGRFMDLVPVADNRAAPVTAPPVGPGGASERHVLPTRPWSMIGRSGLVGELLSSLTVARPVRQVIRGLPGIGKTTLLAALANDPTVRNSFDHVLWTALGPAPSLADCLQSWRDGLVGERGTPASRQNLAEEVRWLLRDRTALLIVDDVWDVEHALCFDVGGPRSAVVFGTRLTSVAELLAHDESEIVVVGPLDEQSAGDLLRRTAPRMTREHPDTAAGILRELEGSPLAIRVAGRLLETELRRGFDLSSIVADVLSLRSVLASRAPTDRFDAQEGVLPTVEALLRQSTSLLDPADRDRFAMLGVMAAKPATFDTAAIAAIWESEQIWRPLRRLLDRGLLEPTSSINRYWLHSLLAAHARDLLESAP